MTEPSSPNSTVAVVFKNLWLNGAQISLTLTGSLRTGLFFGRLTSPRRFVRPIVRRLSLMRRMTFLLFAACGWGAWSNTAFSQIMTEDNVVYGKVGDRELKLDLARPATVSQDVRSDQQHWPWH